MSLELVHLCTLRSVPDPPVDLGVTTAGQRYMVNIREARWEGERLKASLKLGLPAGDWMVISPEGIAHIDIRETLETDDGALIYVRYQGRRDIARVRAGLEAPVYITPLFETSDPRYTWLNSIQAVGKGTAVDNALVYEIYELR